jgi:hypothetical protein
MPTYLAARCSQCSKWIPVRECEEDDPTFDPSLFVELVCPHCGEKTRLHAKAFELVPGSKLQSS